MAAATGTKVGDATNQADVKKAVAETAQANAAYARMLADESTTRARAAAEKGFNQANRTAENLFKAGEQAAEFGRGNVEALAKSAQAYVSGVQDLSRQTVAMVQGLTDQALEGAKALSGVRSLKEAAEVQADLARAAFERVINETTKVPETPLEVAEKTFTTLAARMTMAADKISPPTAA